MYAYVKLLTGAAGLAAVAGVAAPASAQYYPQPGYGYGNNPVGQVINQIFGYGRYPHGNYGYNQYGGQSMAIDQCARAIEARLRGYRGGYYGYGNMGRGYNQYGGQYGGQYGNQYGGGGQVQGITRVERKNYGLKVWGVASSGFRGYSGYGRRDYGSFGYGAGADLSWDCEVRHDGRIRELDINRRTATWRGY